MDKSLNKQKPDAQSASPVHRETHLSENMTDAERRSTILHACLEVGMSPEGAWSFSDRALANKKNSQNPTSGTEA